MTGSLEVAADPEMDNDLRSELVTMAHSSAKRLEATFLRILEFMDTASFGVEEKSFSALDESDLTELLRDSGVELVDIQPARFSATIDMDLLGAVAEEIAANARQAGAVRLTALARQAGGLLTVEISDDGPGFPAGLVNHLFQPFFQADQTGEYPGAGLGLSIVAARLDQAGGSISARPGESGGAVFSVSVPIVEVAESAASTAASA
jgi:signal transduction histidine kinase